MERPLLASRLLEVQLPGHGANVQAQQSSRNIPQGDLTDRGLVTSQPGRHQTLRHQQQPPISQDSGTPPYPSRTTNNLDVLNLGELGVYDSGRGVRVQDELAIRCREGQDWGRRQRLLYSVKGSLPLLSPDGKFLPGQAVEGKCQLSVTSYKASMVVCKTQKHLHFFKRAACT